MFNKLLCKHEWEILQDVLHPSKGREHINLVGEIPAARDRLDFEMFTKRKHMTIVTCNLCGKLKRFTEEV